MDMLPEADNAVCAVRQRLAESLLAVYLHGSAVSGGLRPQSDIDLLVVTSIAVDAETRKKLAADLLKASGHYPFDPHGRRPAELIVFTQNDLCPLPYPARCDFIYGEWLRPAYESGDIPGPVSDPEFTLVLAQARQEAKPLFGPDANDLLPVVPRPDIHQAIAGASQALLEAEPGDERNVLLTLARMWRTLDMEDFVPKDVAAEWAAAQLPKEYASILLDARGAYLGLHVDDLQQHPQQVVQAIQELHKRVAARL
ncbi:MAG: DUF4111 domain-containing protein [Desulfovibrionales bacterium]|nr:DUF4111 domain-containing protein [Desulfovibrionales bacterium]